MAWTRPHHRSPAVLHPRVLNWGTWPRNSVFRPPPELTPRRLYVFATTDTIPNILWRKLSPVMAVFSDCTHCHMDLTIVIVTTFDFVRFLKNMALYKVTHFMWVRLPCFGCLFLLLLLLSGDVDVCLRSYLQSQFSSPASSTRQKKNYDISHVRFMLIMSRIAEQRISPPRTKSKR